MIYLPPIMCKFRKVLGVPEPDFESYSYESWEISPSIHRYVPPAYFLPGQLERIEGAEFASVEEVVQTFRGDFEAETGSTYGFRLKDIDLVDGVLYAGHSCRHLRRRSQRLPLYSPPKEVVSGAIYESWVGNRWFGNWLSDDCLTYELARRYGAPVTTRQTTSGHIPQYEKLLNMKPVRIADAHFDELIVFRDLPNTVDRQERTKQLREQLVSQFSYDAHPGVFLLRGNTGDRRVLINERDVAEQLAAERGFLILDPSCSSVEEIIKACAGARVIAGVEGSHLVHGLLAMPSDATLFVIQPPARTVAALKTITDRQGQGYAFVVASGNNEEFHVCPDEMKRTLDLIPDHHKLN